MGVSPWASCALGAFVAASLARATPAYAGTDGDLVIGALNGEDSTTTLAIKNGNGSPTFVVQDIFGPGPALIGGAETGEGVRGESGTSGGTNPGCGVHGVTDIELNAGVLGENMNGGIAVQGNSVTGTGKGVLGVGHTGVVGLPTGAERAFWPQQRSMGAGSPWRP